MLCHPLSFLLAAWLGFNPGPSNPGADGDPLALFLNEALDRSRARAQEIIRNPDVEADVRNRALAALACVHLVEGHPAEAEAVFQDILAADPGYDLPEPGRLPFPVVDAFYRLRDGRLLAGANTGRGPDIRTLAVGEIENNSVIEGRFDLDHFARGLSQIIMSDLDGATSLVLVDRRRLHALQNEIALSRSNITDPSTRIPFGRLTGAHSFLFGSLMQVDADYVRLDLRWVDTTTGEVLLAEGGEHRLKNSQDLFDLERRVLLDLLLPKLEVLLDDRGAVGEDVRNHLQAKETQVGGGSRYLDTVVAVGRAVQAEEDGRWKSAFRFWTEVLTLDPDNAAAHARLQALKIWIDRAEPE